MLEFVFDSNGTNIGYFMNGHLWSMDGTHVARFLVNEGIFINRAGTYVGEMYMGRIVYNQNSPHRNTSFGKQGDFGKLGHMQQLGRLMTITLPRGYVTFQG